MELRTERQTRKGKKKEKKDEQHGKKTKTGMNSGVLAKGKQFLLLIRHPPCYSYIQSRMVKSWQ
jgi:hypothetical protein